MQKSSTSQNIKLSVKKVPKFVPTEEEKEKFKKSPNPQQAEIKWGIEKKQEWLDEQNRLAQQNSTP